MELDTLKTDALSKMAAPYNPRKISPHDLNSLRRSMQTFGVVEPIIVNKRTGHIVGGHQRVKAAQAAAIETLPVVHVDLSEGQERALNIALNRVRGDFDQEMLAEVVADILSAGEDVTLTGLTDEELEALVDAQGEGGAGDADPDDVPEPPAVTVTQTGDLIRLGDHWLLCGDATKPEDVARLVGERPVDLLLTDPPYNVEYEGKTAERLTIENDRMSDSAYTDLLLGALRNAHDALAPGGAFYLWHADLEGLLVRGAVALAGLQVRQCLVWVKSVMVLGRQDYQWRHEPCLYGWKDGGPHLWANDRKQTTVLEFEKPQRNADHPTMKPEALFAYLIGNSTVREGRVLDLFAGSGTTAIACERLKRTALLMELDPIYCDVIVRRWETFTGKAAVRPRS